MALEKVKIASAIEKEYNNKKYLTITLADGRTGSSSDVELKDKLNIEIELDVKPAKEYNGVQQYYFNIPKETHGGGKFPAKNYAFEKRRVALECATELIKGTDNLSRDDDTLKFAESFYQFLNKP